MFGRAPLPAATAAAAACEREDGRQTAGVRAPLHKWRLFGRPKARAEQRTLAGAAPPPRAAGKQKHAPSVEGDAPNGAPSRLLREKRVRSGQTSRKQTDCARRIIRDGGEAPSGNAPEADLGARESANNQGNFAEWHEASSQHVSTPPHRPVTLRRPTSRKHRWSRAKAVAATTSNSMQINQSNQFIEQSPMPLRLQPSPPAAPCPAFGSPFCAPPSRACDAPGCSTTRSDSRSTA